MQKFKTFLTVIGAVTILVLAANSAVYAATGGKFVLGRTNKASKVSTLKRTKPGPALNLVTKSSANAPLSTNGTGLVTNLNADKVDGLDASALTNNVRVFTGVISTPTSTYTKQLSLPPGKYMISYTASLPGGSGNSRCVVRTFSPDDTPIAFTAEDSASITWPSMSGIGLITQDATHLNDLLCASGTTFTTMSTDPIQIVAQQVESVISASNLRTAPSAAQVAK